MAAAAADEPGAFERLVTVYTARVRAAVARSIRDPSSVDDLAQEVFLRLYRARHRYQPTARFETYLYRIVFNLCVNHTQHRRRRRAWSLQAPMDGDEGRSHDPADPSGRLPLMDLEAGERAAAVRRAVDALPENQRRALLLFRFEGLSYEEVASVMDVSLPAVKSLLWRARETLRRGLRPILGESP
jgi:RNA polymerase sigma-70 factor (ECF subfamily)